VRLKLFEADRVADLRVVRGDRAHVPVGEQGSVREPGAGVRGGSPMGRINRSARRSTQLVEVVQGDRGHVDEHAGRLRSHSSANSDLRRTNST